MPDEDLIPAEGPVASPSAEEPADAPAPAPVPDVALGGDLVESTRALLRELDLLGDAEESPAVASVQADPSNASIFWAVASGALVALAWALVAIWWSGEETANQVAAVGGAAIITAAALLSVGYLMAADVRGRTAAAVAAIQARESIALAMIEASAAAEAEREAARAAAAATPGSGLATAPSELVALPKKVKVRYLTRPKGDRKGWTAIAIERRGGGDEGEAEGEIRYLLVRRNEKAMADAKEVSFD